MQTDQIMKNGVCVHCGFRAEGRHCKIVCSTCGKFSDCSDG